jgi:hypothetical protein
MKRCKDWTHSLPSLHTSVELRASSEVIKEEHAHRRELYIIPVSRPWLCYTYARHECIGSIRAWRYIPTVLSSVEHSLDVTKARDFKPMVPSRMPQRLNAKLLVIIKEGRKCRGRYRDVEQVCSGVNVISRWC